MSDKITKLELHFNFHNRFLRGSDRIPGHKKSYAADYLNFSDRKLIGNEELYNIIFITNEEEVVEAGYNLCGIYLSQAYNVPCFSQCFTKELKEKLEPHFLYLDFSLLDKFKFTSGISGRVTIERKNDIFAMSCEFVSLPPLPLKRTSISFVFANNNTFACAIDKISLVAYHLTLV